MGSGIRSPHAVAAATGRDAAGGGWTRARLLVTVTVAVALVYVGCEVTAGQWSPTLFTLSRHLTMGQAAIATGAFWAAFALGRVATAVSAGRWNADRLLAMSSTVAVIGGLIVLSSPGWLAVVGLVVAGAAMGPLFPTLIATTSSRFGARAARVIGWQVSASAVGGALAPTLIGAGIASRGASAIAVTLAGGLAVVALLIHAATRLAPA